jgi:DNA polymerase
MHRVVLAHEADFPTWRAATRAHALAGTPGEALEWRVGEADVPTPLPAAEGGFSVPRALVALAEAAIQAADPERFALLYRLVCRAHAGDYSADDPDMLRARRLALEARRETHRMAALIRFLPVRAAVVCHVGWFEPAAHVTDAVARAYARDFPHLALSILTPGRAAHWVGDELVFGPGVPGAAVADDAALAQAWQARYADLFFRARLPPAPNVPPVSELRPPDRPALGPVRLPVAGSADAMVRAAQEASGCTRCQLAGPATQTVFGEGPVGAPIMFIGEQPGDQEDIIGRPFVGPAGQLLDQALEEAGIDRRQVYVANAVKHFKHIPRGTRRLHQTPEAPEVEACRFWLEAERDAVRPRLIVLLGATAARAVLGRPVTIGRERGEAFDLPDGARGFITVHPSFLLRQPDEESRARQYALFVSELRRAAALAAGLG